MPREQSKCREWEKERRDRLNNSFQALSKLLPSYDPSLTLSKIEILQRAAAYIEQLLKRNNDLTSDEKKSSAEKEEINRLCERIKKLLVRNEQLATLLTDAGIKIPAECGLVKNFTPKLPWSNKISAEQANVFKKKLLQKENETPKSVKSPKKKNTSIKSKLKSPISVGVVKPRKLKNGRKKPISVLCADRRNSVKVKLRKNKILTPSIMTVVNNGNLAVLPTQTITLPYPQPCYVIANASFASLHNKSRTAVVTQTRSLSSPIVASSIQPSGLTSQSQSSLSALGPGTLILANGNIMPVLPSSGTIFKPSPSIITQSTPILVNSNPQNNATLIVMPTSGSKTTKESDKKHTNDGLAKGAAPSKTLAVLQPKMMPVPLKKVPIPALGSRYFSALKAKSAAIREKKVLAAKSIKKVKKAAKDDTASGSDSKAAAGSSCSDSKKTGETEFSPPEVEKENPVSKKRVQENEGTDSEDAKRSKFDESEPKEIQEASNYSIDSLCKDAEKVVCEITANSEKKALNAYEKIANTAKSVSGGVLGQQQFEEATSEIQSNVFNDVQNATEQSANNRMAITSSATSGESAKEIQHLNVDNPLQRSRESVSDVVSATSESISTSVSVDSSTHPVTSCHTLTHSELLPHSELSNDIFATLQVPNGIGGSQNPDSTSPTAAFLLAFPLVQTYTGVKVSEVMDEENSDSQQDTPTLLQIGTMESTKPTQSESLTPSLLNLDNFSFFSSKDINSFYPSYDTNSTGALSSSNTPANLQQQQPKAGVETQTENQVQIPEKCKTENALNDVLSNVSSKTQNFNLPNKNPHLQPLLQSGIINLTSINKSSNNVNNFDVSSNNKPPVNVSIANSNNYSSIMSVYQEKHHGNSYQLPPQPVNYCICNTSTTHSLKSTIALNNKNSANSCNKPNNSLQQNAQKNPAVMTTMLPPQNAIPVSTFQENSKVLDSNLSYSKKPQKLNEQRCSYTCSSSTSSTYSFSGAQCNTFNPFTDFTPSFGNFSHASTAKACSEPLYTNSTNYNYGYQQSSDTTTNNFSHSNYPTHQTKASTKLPKNQCTASYESGYATPSVNYKYPDSKTSTSSYYCPLTNPVTKDTSKSASKNSTNSDNLIRPPVNWMTTPDLRHQNPNSDYLVPPFGKDLDFCQNPIFPPNNFTATNQSYYNTNTSVYSTPDMQTFTSDARKPILESPFHVLPPNSFQRNDILQPEDNQYSWSPSKIPPLLDSQHNLSLVPSTLPTLIGDLALGINSGTNSMLGDKKMNDGAAIKADASCRGKETSSNVNKKMKQSAPTYDNQSNFLSVSQLVEHGKPEVGASRTVSRRNSGSRSNKPVVQRQKSRSSKMNDQNKEHVDAQQQLQQQQNVDMHNKNFNLQNANQRENNWNSLGETVSAKSNKHYKSSSSNYSAEALIGHQIGSNVNLGNSSSTKQSSYSSHNFHYPPPPPPTAQSSKSLQMSSFMSDNIFLPSVDFQAQDNFSHQQNQSYHHHHQTNSFTPSLQNSVYPSSSYISSAPTITSSYLPSGSLLSEIGNEFINVAPIQDNLFAHSNKDKIATQGVQKTSANASVRSDGNKTNNSSNAGCSVVNANSGNKKANKRKHAHASTGVGVDSSSNSNNGISSSSTSGFVDLSFLSIPGSINSPILPDDYHTHANFLPPPPPNPSQFFPCKNSLYPKQTADLLPPPPRHATVQHPETSPIGTNIGTSLTNFNLSTIFPEINKGPVSGLYSSSVRSKNYQLSKNDNLLGHSISQVSFNNKVVPPRTLSYSSNGIPSTSISFPHN